ncbi:MAG: Flp pilus assembly protein CpaB [Candidatus Limnocylindria bacterium]
MKRSNRLVILVGVLLAILAFVGIIIFLNQQAPEPVEEAEITETVLVATGDIAIGDELTPDRVEELEVPPDAVIGTPLRDPSQAGGRPALFAVPAGSQVSLETIGLGVTGPENIAAQLQPGEKAVSVRLDPQTGMNFLVQPGDSVDIVISSEVAVLQPTEDSLANPDQPPRFEQIEGLAGARTVKTVLQDKRVLYVSATSVTQPPPAVEEDEEDPAEAPAEAEAELLSIILVFAGTDQDAEIVKYIQRDNFELSSEATEIPGSISVVIRSADDEAIEETTGITIDQLVEQYGLRVPGIVEQLNEEAPGP